MRREEVFMVQQDSVQQQRHAKSGPDLKEEVANFCLGREWKIFQSRRPWGNI